jgi:putative GTP pyrophosphokinase
LHVHVEYPVYLSSGVVPTRVEIQFRTIAMDFWASIEHKIYYKYREKAPKVIQAELKECAELITSLDDCMYMLKQVINEFEEKHPRLQSENNFYREESNYFKEAVPNLEVPSLKIED